MFTKILTAFDFSEPSKRALAWGTKMATHDAARLELLHVIPPHIYATDTLQAREELVQYAEAAIERELLRTTGDDGTKTPRHHVVVAHGNPSHAILDHIRRSKPDLVVIGSHGRSGLTRVLMGSVAERVVRYASAPVLVVRGELPQKLQRIMVPVDFSGETEQTMKFLEDFAKQYPVQFVLVHVVPNLTQFAYPADPGFGPPPRSLEERESEAKTYLNELVERYPHLDIMPVTLTGDIIDNLSDYCAKQQFDLVIAPTHGKSGIERFLLGSTAEQVIRYVDCNVLSFVYGKYLDMRTHEVNEVLTQSNISDDTLHTGGIGIH